MKVVLVAVHADGKKMDQHGEVVERFPILLSGFSDGTVRLVRIPTIEDGRGETMANMIYNTITPKYARTKIAGVAGDTCSANLGSNSGMFAKLEALIGKAILWSPCRHHSVDLFEKTAFKTIFGPTRSPKKAEFL